MRRLFNSRQKRIAAQSTGKTVFRRALFPVGSAIALVLASSTPSAGAAMKSSATSVTSLAAATSAYTCSTTYYVDPLGRDTANGLTASTAWKTLAKVSASKFAPGSCILLKSDAVFTGTLSLGADDANDPARPVVVTTTGADKAWISAGTAKGISVYNTGGVTIKNLGIYGSGYSKNSTNGIDVYTDTPNAKQYYGITIDSVDVSGFGASGISIAGTPSDHSKSGFEDVTIVNTLAHANGDAGIQSYGNFSSTSTTYSHSNFMLDHVAAYGNVGISTKGSNSGSGIVLGDVNGAVIQNSVASDNGANNGNVGGGPVGIWAWDSNKVAIAHNESYANKSGTVADGDGFDLDGGVTNSVMEYNYSHDNAGAGFLVYQYAGARAQANNVVRYNISQNDARSSIYGAVTIGGATGYPARNVDVYGNTLFVAPSKTGGTPAGIRVWGGATNTRFFNNIVFAPSGTILASVEKSTTTTFLGNDWWTSGGAFKILVGGSSYSDQKATQYSSLTAWSNATGAERSSGQLVGKSVDPQLTAPGQGPTFGDASKLTTLTAYMLRSGSTVADAGVNLANAGILNGGVDFYGNVAPYGAYSIGAHER
jgi:hypothetical protein